MQTDKKNKIKISVIIASYNASETIEQCINSYVSQSHPDKELIIIDNESIDGTVDVINQYTQNINYWISEPDSGVYHAWNKAIKIADGDWIMFLGADDYFDNDKVLESVSSYMNNVPDDIRVVYGKLMFISRRDRPMYEIGGPWDDNVRKMFLDGLNLPHPAVLHRKSLFIEHGEFDESFRIAGDYELLLRELKDNQAYHVPEVFVCMRQQGKSNLPANSLDALHEVRRAQLKHDLSSPSMYWVRALAMAYMRVMLWKLLGDRAARRAIDFLRSLFGRQAYWTKT